MSPGMNYNVRLKKVKNSYRTLTEVKIKREKKIESIPPKIFVASVERCIVIIGIANAH